MILGTSRYGTSDHDPSYPALAGIRRYFPFSISSILPFFFKRYITFQTEGSEVFRIRFASVIEKTDLFSSSMVNSNFSSFVPNFMFCVIILLLRESIVTQILISYYLR